MPPIAPGGDRFSEALEASRRFLLSIANAELPARLRAKGGASDLVQETFAAAHRSRDQFRGRTLADLRAWLRAILVNELAAFRRHYTGTASRDVNREVALDRALPTARDAPIVQMVRREREQLVAGAVTRLPDESRLVLVLHVEHNWSFAAIGRHLDRSEDAARKLFTRALGALREATRSAAE